VYYRVGQRGIPALSLTVVRQLVGLIRDTESLPSDNLSVLEECFPEGVSSVDTSLVLLGWVFREIAGRENVSFLDAASPAYLVELRGALGKAIGMLAAEADRSGERETSRLHVRSQTSLLHY